MSEVTYNPFQPGFTDNPYPHYAELRSVDPVHHSPLGLWMLLDYDDVTRLLRDPNLSMDESYAHATPLTELIDTTVGTERPGGEHAMLNVDPPDHTRLRRLVSKAFTPRTVQRLESRIQTMVDTRLDAAAERGSLELMGDLAFPLPFAVISEMLGMPDTGVEGDEIRHLSGTLVRSLEPVLDPELLRSIDTASRRLYEILAAAVAAKREQPGDDLMTALIAAEEDGDTLSTDELVDQVTLLYLAGHETTVNLIGNGVRALLAHPDQLDLLRQDPDLAENAVEELLRFDSPVQMTRRIAREPVEVQGREIEAGAFIVLGLAAANRDPGHWGPTVDQLDLRREDASHHVSFGGGHHYCLGSALARLEARIAIGTLVRRFPTIEPTAEPVWNGRINLRGLERLPLSVAG
jgi:cytochrome P450